MNILFVTSAYPSREKPYYCIYLEQQAKALQALGDHVEILLLTRGQEDAHYSQNGIQIHEMGLGNSRVEKLITTAKNRRRLEGFSWNRFQAVSIHFGRLAHMNTIVDICKKQGVATVRHFHGLNVWEEYIPAASPAHRLYEAYLTERKKRLLRRCDGVVGVSELVCTEVRKKIRKEAVYTVYNGVDLERFCPPAEKEPGTLFRLLCVANLIPLKGQRYLLEAVRSLKERPLKLTLIGEGADRKMLEDMCEALGIKEQVEFLGPKDYDSVARYMRNSDLFVMPSCYEAFGCVFVEAMSSGLLTCGCRGTGAEEIITHGVNGLLLEQKDPESIAEAIRFAMDNNDRAVEIAARGRERSREFSWERSGQMLRQVYTRISAGE